MGQIVALPPRNRRLTILEVPVGGKLGALIRFVNGQMAQQQKSECAESF
jgi:hypothetical protein